MAFRPWIYVLCPKRAREGVQWARCANSAGAGRQITHSISSIILRAGSGRSSNLVDFVIGALLPLPLGPWLCDPCCCCCCWEGCCEVEALWAGAKPRLALARYTEPLTDELRHTRS